MKMAANKGCFLYLFHTHEVFPLFSTFFLIVKLWGDQAVY
jgi:hypothetical protein